MAHIDTSALLDAEAKKDTSNAKKIKDALAKNNYSKSAE